MKSIWIEFLSEFNFEIKYIKGKKNRVAYALSRRGILMPISPSSDSKSKLKVKFQEAFRLDNHFQQVAAALQSGIIHVKFSKYSMIEDGII